MFSLDVNSEIEMPVNLMALLARGDYRTKVEDLAYDALGMKLVWNFVTVIGVYSQTEITLSESGNYAWINKGDGMYGIIIPASGGETVNNDTCGFGWITGMCNSTLAWCGPMITFKQ